MTTAPTTDGVTEMAEAKRAPETERGKSEHLHRGLRELQEMLAPLDQDDQEEILDALRVLTRTLVQQKQTPLILFE